MDVLRNWFIDLGASMGLSSSAKPNQEALEKTYKTADYLGSRGADGLTALKKLATQTSVDEGGRKAALPRGWNKAIPLHGAAMNAHVDTTLAYLVDDLGCDLDKKNGDGDAPLHVAVTWGRPEVADYLLSRGAFFAAKDADGLTPREAAHRRQSLLESGDPAYVARCVEKGMDIPGLREGGKALCKLLDGVAAAGSYTKYAAARQ